MFKVYKSMILFTTQLVTVHKQKTNCIKRLLVIITYESNETEYPRYVSKYCESSVFYLVSQVIVFLEWKEPVPTTFSQIFHHLSKYE